MKKSYICIPVKQLEAEGETHKMPNQLVSWLVFVQRVICLREMPIISILNSPADATLTSSNLETQWSASVPYPLIWGLGMCMK